MGTQRAPLGPNGSAADAGNILQDDESTPSTTKQPDVIATDFEEFPDKTILELVGLDQNARRKLSLLVWSDGQSRIADQYLYNNRLYVPRTFEPTLLASIRFPNEETPDSSLDNSKLFHTLEKFLEKYVDV